MTADGRWREAGDRIQTLLDAVGSPGISGAGARGRAEQLVREVVGLYGATLERIVDLADADTLHSYATDDLVASLLLVHGLHPHDVRRRVSDALDQVRPYLGSHGGDIELIDVTADLVVRLRLAGSCKSCPSSAVTLELTVEDAVHSAAPEVVGIEVVTEPAAGTVFPAATLLDRVHSRAPTQWQPAAELEGLSPGEVGGFVVSGVAIVACRVGDRLFAYRDHCPGCDDTLAGALLHKRMDSGDPVLRCPRCHLHFDVVHAGTALEPGALHLEPVPLLTHDGQLCLALAAEPTGLSA